MAGEAVRSVVLRMDAVCSVCGGVIGTGERAVVRVVLGPGGRRRARYTHARSRVAGVSFSSCRSGVLAPEIVLARRRAVQERWRAACAAYEAGRGL